VLEGRPQYVEMTGNLSVVSKSGEQPYVEFNSFYENRLPLVVRVRDPHQDPTGRVAFFREPRTARSDLPQPPTCSLNLRLPNGDESATGVVDDAGKTREDDETESKSLIHLCDVTYCMHSVFVFVFVLFCIKSVDRQLAIELETHPL